MARSNPPGTLRKSAAFLGRVVVLVIALVLVTTCDSGPPNQNHIPTPTPTPLIDINQCSAHSSTPIKLNMYYGSEKQEWMEQARKQFNALKLSACDGPITVDATPIGSGAAMQKILNGDQPDIWVPAGRVWLSLLNAQWQQMGQTGDLVATTSIDSPSLMLSPVVIGIWKSRAIALGWPNKQIGWSDIAALSTSPQGWAAYGHPEWGMFKFAHTSPPDSNSGLDSVIAEFYAAFPKKTSGLSLDDVDNAQAQSFVAGIERSIIYYGGTDPNQDSTGYFADTMCKQGQNALDAAVLYESLVVEMNEGKLSHCPEPVVALYPQEGSLLSDHPFAIPQWVNAAHRTSALAFRNYLLAHTQQQKALTYGFRPSDLTISLTTPLTTANGVDPTQPTTFLQLPSVDVVQAILGMWDQLRHKVAVMLLLDTSGSMSYQVDGVTKITAATAGIKEFLKLLSPMDWAGLTTFSTETHVLFPVAPLGPNIQQMLQALDSITAGGNTRLYNSIAEQVQALSDLTTDNIKALVVLTDGVDTVHQLSLAQLLQEIASQHVRVFTIAYGDSSYMDKAGLTQIAQATGGKECPGTPQDIQQVYQQINQFLVGSSSVGSSSQICS